jgi:hypothetical protein
VRLLFAAAALSSGASSSASSSHSSKDAAVTKASVEAQMQQERREFNPEGENGGLAFDHRDFRTRGAFFAHLEKLRFSREAIANLTNQWDAVVKIVGRGINSTGEKKIWSGTGWLVAGRRPVLQVRNVKATWCHSPKCPLLLANRPVSLSVDAQCRGSTQGGGVRGSCAGAPGGQWDRCRESEKKINPPRKLASTNRDCDELDFVVRTFPLSAEVSDKSRLLRVTRHALQWEASARAVRQFPLARPLSSSAIRAEDSRKAA